MQDIMDMDIVQYSLKQGVYLVENKHKKQFLVVMTNYGVGQAYDLSDASEMSTGRNILETLGVTRILRLEGETEVYGKWYRRAENGQLMLEEDTKVLDDFRQVDGFGSVEAFEKCKIRPDATEVKRRDSDDNE